jgi:hypothetical protein
MSQALELARYKVKPENRAALDAARPALVGALHRFPGFIDIQFSQLDETTFLDVCRWESREQAEAAAAEAPNDPDCARVFALIDEVVSFEHASIVDEPAAARGAA